MLHVSNKLAGEWSAGSVTGMLSPAVVEYLTTEKKWDALDPLIKARLLLSPLFLRLKELHELEEPLKKLKLAGTADRDEWVRVMAAAVGPYDGRLHMDDVIKESKVVKTTLEDVRRLAADADPSLFRPLEVSAVSKCPHPHAAL